MSEERTEDIKEFLNNYNPNDYERPSVTVDMLLFTVSKNNIIQNTDDNMKLKLLLIQRKNHPYKGDWAIPGGFVDINEDLEKAVYRELKEETDIDNVYLEQLHTWGDVGRDPRMRIISASYMALASSETLNPKAGDDANDTAWFDIEKVIVNKTDEVCQYELSISNKEKDIHIKYLVEDKVVRKGKINTKETTITHIDGYKQLAFDHCKIINLAIDELRKKIWDTPIVFNLMNDKFALSDLQKTYEAILDTSLTTPNFRRRVGRYVYELNEFESNVAHRPARLFKYNGNL